MKTAAALHARSDAAIVRLADAPPAGAVPHPPHAPGVAPTSNAEDEVHRARAFAEPLLTQRLLDTGEPAWSHAEGVATLLADIGAAPLMRAAAYLVYAADFLARPQEVVEKGFGASQAALVVHTRRLVQLQRVTREAQMPAQKAQQQTERVGKMLLAFSRDLRVVLMRLASRLQTLRWHAASREPCPAHLAQESLQVFAPLANRLGIWQIKWEMEDLAFRFLQPQDYHRIAALLAETRVQREAAVQHMRQQLVDELAGAGIEAEVQGRPKHLYSIWKKMQGKQLDFEQVYDRRALRVLVADVPACYAVLSCVHAAHAPVAGQFDDYIARPKANGYQSLHTVVRDAQGQPVEVQIRTPAMHQLAEHGVAAHWAYKEAGVRGYAGVSVDAASEGRLAEARRAVLRQLLAWEREQAGAAEQPSGDAPEDDRIYVLTPDAALIELPQGATPVDFAYSLHTDLGHRCRGAKVDGRVVPLNSRLAHGQTVEIVAAKEGGPSLDWLNPELHFLASPRSRAKVRAWFNAQAQTQTVARGRELVEKLLQREGRTAIKLDELAAQLGFKGAETLFELVGKDEFSLRSIEQLLRPATPPATGEQDVILHRPQARGGGVLVVGMDSLLTSLARCCRPAPPDAIGGFVTRGKGVAIHRSSCPNYRQMALHDAPRVIAVAWGADDAEHKTLYPVDLAVQAEDRPGLLRDISEVFQRHRLHLTGMQRDSAHSRRGAPAWLKVSAEVNGAQRLSLLLRELSALPGVIHARRQ